MSLIEMTAVIALNSIVMGIAISVFVSLQQVDRSLHDRQDTQREVARLISRLRDDLRAAASYEFDPDAEELRLPGVADGKVVYLLTAGERCERRMLDDGVPTVADAFRLPSDGKWTVDAVESPNRELVRIAWAPAESEDRGNAQGWEAIVEAGRDRRLLHE